MRLLPQAALPLLLAAAPSHVAGHGPHGDIAFPKLMGGGRRFLSELVASARAEMAANARNMARAATTALEHMEGLGASEDEDEDQDQDEAQALDRRQVGGTDGQCGPGFGSCAEGYCCSPEGWCGLTPDYCSAPDCLINYGSGCDANQKPNGVDMTSVPRPHVGSVLYGGVGIYDCVVKGDIAVTFDDGPYNYTGDLLDKLASYGAKATFFITGNNLGKGMINDYSKPWAGYIRRMIAEGHQVASHTWSHQNASQLTTTQYRHQINWNEIAFNDILGFFPTYMRPPYSICEASCQAILYELGYHVTYFDLDTEGYLHDDPSLIQTSKDIWDDAVDNTDPSTTNYLMIEHDIHYQTVYNLTDYVLTSLFAKGYRSVTVGECLGDPKENWYRMGTGGGGTGGGGATATTPGPLPSTTIHKGPSRTGGGGGDDGGDDGDSADSNSRRPDRPVDVHAGSATASTVAAASTSTASPVTVLGPDGSALQMTTDGNCGKGITCLNSRFGNCCSANGWCGSSADYCGSTCQPQFGACSDTPR
ncbi:Glycoside hydrolase/deacetylase, beta/alpha-barrel [Niveomyces insectorum RCEF 264]|uniref:Glycoside hydrolase/deacetylase, beta/alpha-barrel n=1 Tax=Niveomyces insectorum RCEF 264 TaxID=1081102 RepID=A0A167M245_9HYPO|nr:Glycoside hydrolase/deacetylase, beta/alpha-barrel [Niveomyces insectorum RCEF 264]